jgi:hypothetical protein
MLHQPNRRQPLDEHEIDQAVLDLLVHRHGAGPWATEELAREIGDPIAVNDALARLYGGGLIHRLHEFAFPTRATLRAIELTN